MPVNESKVLDMVAQHKFYKCRIVMVYNFAVSEILCRNYFHFFIGKREVPDLVTLFRKSKSLFIYISILFIFSFFIFTKFLKVIMFAEYHISGLDYVDGYVGAMACNPVTVVDVVGKYYTKFT